MTSYVVHADLTPAAVAAGLVRRNAVAIPVGPPGPTPTLPFTTEGTFPDPDGIVFDGPDTNVEFVNGRGTRPRVGVITFGDGDEVPSKSHFHGQVAVFEINDSPEFIGRRSEGQFVDGGTLAFTTLTTQLTNFGSATQIVCANLYPGTVAFRDTGYVMVEDPNGSTMAFYSYTSIDRNTGVISGLTLMNSAGTTLPVGSYVEAMIPENTNLFLCYGQADMGQKGGFQDRSAGFALFTAEPHRPDSYGHYYSAGYIQWTTSSPGPQSQRRTQMTLNELGNLALFGSGLLDKSAMTSTKRFQVAPKNTRTNGTFSLPAASIPVLDPSGFPTAGTVTITSDAGSQTITYTGYSATGGVWYLTGCAGGTGTVADAAFVQLSKVNNITVIGAVRGNIVAQDDASNDTVTIGKIGPTAADAEAGIQLGGASGSWKLYRGASGEAWTTQTLRFKLASGSVPGVAVGNDTDTEPRVSLRIGAVMWGPGSATPVDLSLRRASSTELVVRDAGDTADRDLRLRTLKFGSGGPTSSAGAGSPEGAVTAPIGSTYHRTDGGAGTSFYVKESGAGNTGWAAK